MSKLVFVHSRSMRGFRNENGVMLFLSQIAIIKKFEETVIFKELARNQPPSNFKKLQLYIRYN